jgi:subtilisin family serine protease
MEPYRGVVTKGQQQMRAFHQPANGRAGRTFTRMIGAAAAGAVTISLFVAPVAAAAADDANEHGRRNAAPTTTTAAPPTTTSTPANTTPVTPALPSPPKDVAGQYIVTVKPGVDPDAVANETKGRGHTVEHVYHSAARGFASELSTAEVARLQSDPRVERVEADQEVHALDTQSPAPSWGLDRVDERVIDGTSAYTYPNTASNVTAYIIDTGIYAANGDFGTRVAAGHNFAGGADDTNTTDCNGHGTHVAGTIGGTTYGLAKGIALVPVRVLNCNGSGSWSDVVAGLDWVASNHSTGKAVANLSLGGGYSQSVNDAVARVVQDGVVVAVAAGNDNGDACASSPASTPTALTVGATDAADNRASFSNYGSCVDLFAPGVNIKSDWSGSATATNTISGTSMATPHVAGVAALYLADGKTTADLMANVTTGRVINPGTGSPNRLLYVGTEACTPTTCPPEPPAPTPPANDPFAGAQGITTTTGVTTGTNVAATKESGEPNHAGFVGGRSIWYRFTAAANGTATVDTLGSSFDTLLAVYTGSAVDGLTSIASNDDTTTTLQSRVQFTVTANTAYQVAIDGYNAANGNVTLNWTLPSGAAPPPSGTTGWKSPTAQTADSGGDGNGYEKNPTRAFADDGQYAQDSKSGNGTTTGCTSTQKDKHRFSGYSLSVPSGATIKGVEVQVQAKADNTANEPQLCVQLSTDGGGTWTAAKTTATLTKNEAAYVVGGTADLWGLAWTDTSFGSGFRVRIVDIASSTSRDFSVDVVSVRVTY